MRVFIDRTRCEGTTYCVAVSDAAFRMGDDGLAELAVPQDDDLLTELRDELEEAENLCPTGAISVVDRPAP